MKKWERKAIIKPRELLIDMTKIAYELFNEDYMDFDNYNKAYQTIKEFEKRKASEANLSNQIKMRADYLWWFINLP